MENAAALSEFSPAEVERFADHLPVSGLERRSARRRIAGGSMGVLGTGRRERLAALPPQRGPLA